MRSGNGSRPFSLSVCTLTLFACLSLEGSQEYLISYRYHVKNAKLYNESLQISQAMKPCLGKKYAKSLILEKKESTKQDFHHLIKQNRESLINYLEQLSISVKNKDSLSNNALTSATTITFKTECFKVDFNDNFVIITPLK
jgi:hypothetical protein